MTTDGRRRATDGGMYWCATCDHSHLMHWGHLNVDHGCRIETCPCTDFVPLLVGPANPYPELPVHPDETRLPEADPRNDRARLVAKAQRRIDAGARR
jgi:hypothetical protein